jgi:tetratricopeptide (TPR) repeat protein
MSKILCAWLCCAAVVALPLLCAAGDVPEGDVEFSGRENGGLVSNKPVSRQDNVNVRGRKFDGGSGASATVYAMNAGPATTHFRLAEELTLAGRLDAALSSYTVAITLEPDHTGALQGRWRLCSRLSLHRQALKDLNRLIELMPGRAEYYYERGRTLLKLNSVREAYRDFLHANELDRRYPRPTLIEDDAPTGKVLVA